MYAVKTPPAVAHTRNTHTLALITFFTSPKMFLVGASLSGTYKNANETGIR